MVLFTAPTAQLVSRMRERYGNRIDMDTCHAAYGLFDDGNAPGSVSSVLATHDALEIIDEVSQLDGEHFKRICRFWA